MSTLALLDDTDLPWLTEVVDVVTAAAGQPWRVALEQLDDARRSAQPRAPVRFAAAVTAVQRVLGGRARNAARARRTRSLVLGTPVLTPAEREARIAFAASELAITCAAVETLLWSDLPRERPVELPRGRPSELEIAAFANIQLLQRVVRRAQSVQLRVWGDAGPLIRAAALRGLLATISIERAREVAADNKLTVAEGSAMAADSSAMVATSSAMAPDTSAMAPDSRAAVANHSAVVATSSAMLGNSSADRGATVADSSTVVANSSVTVIDIVGPLALFHRTSVYGKALADLVPLLAGCERFTLHIEARGRDDTYAVEVESPVLLPAVPARLASAGHDISQLANTLERHARAAGLRGFSVRPPCAMAAGASLVCPDLLLELPPPQPRMSRRLYVEVLGFWTTEFVARKLALYRKAGVDDVVICVDDSRGCTKDELPEHPRVLRYPKRVTALAGSLIALLARDQ